MNKWHNATLCFSAFRRIQIFEEITPHHVDIDDDVDVDIDIDVDMDVDVDVNIDVDDVDGDLI